MGNNGFSLVELIVVIMIVGILSAIAVPSYKAYQSRVKVANFMVQLNALKDAATKYYSMKNSWPNSFDQIGYATDANVGGVVFPGANIFVRNDSNCNYFYFASTIDQSEAAVVFPGLDIQGSSALIFMEIGANIDTGIISAACGIGGNPPGYDVPLTATQCAYANWFDLEPASGNNNCP